MPPLENLLGGAILLALTVYAVLGGADFGGGVWDLLAAGPRQSAQRQLIGYAIAPVWEVNHVWLILAIVLLFSGFPRAFAEIGTHLHVPLVLVLMGILARGSAFAFRAFDTRAGQAAARWGLLFSVSSLLTPLLLGASIGAIASGTLRWVGLFPAAIALFALALFSFLAAVYLSAEATDFALADDFRFRALAAAAVVTVLAGAVLALSRSEAPQVFHGLLGSNWALGLHGLTGVFASLTLHALWTRRFGRARITAAIQVGLIVLGWGAAQYPYLIVPNFTMAETAVKEATLKLLLISLSLGMLVLIPSLALLFHVFKSSFHTTGSRRA